MNKLWDLQEKFTTKFFKDQKLLLKELSYNEQLKWTKEYAIHIHKELTDLVSCFPTWKMHYKNVENNFIDSNMKEEFTDCLKYLLGLGQVLGLTYKDAEEAFINKTLVVEQKYEQDKIIDLYRKKKTKVVVFDIDGVINTYPDCFIDYIHKLGCAQTTIEQVKLQNEKFYADAKQSYRLSGYKRNLPVIEDTVKTINTLKKQGRTIVLYTVRPVLKYKRIFSDTLEWLKKNKINFDMIFWSDYNKRDIYKLGLSIDFIVEDTLENTVTFNKAGYRVYLLDKYHNQGYSHPLTTRIKSCLEIL